MRGHRYQKDIKPFNLQGHTLVIPLSTNGLTCFDQTNWSGKITAAV